MYGMESCISFRVGSMDHEVVVALYTLSSSVHPFTFSFIFYITFLFLFTPFSFTQLFLVTSPYHPPPQRYTHQPTIGKSSAVPPPPYHTKTKNSSWEKKKRKKSLITLSAASRPHRTLTSRLDPDQRWQLRSPGEEVIPRQHLKERSLSIPFPITEEACTEVETHQHAYFNARHKYFEFRTHGHAGTLISVQSNPTTTKREKGPFFAFLSLPPITFFPPPLPALNTRPPSLFVIRRLIVDPIVRKRVNRKRARYLR